MSRPRVTMVVNPAAGLGRAQRCVPAVTACLTRVADVDVVSATDVPGSRQAVRAGAGRSDAVIVVGGDGMVHHALQELAGGTVPLGIVPAGTGNDAAASIGLPADPVAAAGSLARALTTSSVRRIDVGRVDVGRFGTADANGAPDRRWWLTVLCAGFDSAVNARADRLRWPPGPRRYDLAIALEALRLRPRHYDLELDGRRHQFDAIMVSVCNTPRYGGGKLIAPTARLDDGLFTVCVIGPVSRRTLARLAPRLDAGGHVDHPAVSFHAATTVALDADRIAYADGERIGIPPVRTECVHRGLPVLAPD